MAKRSVFISGGGPSGLAAALLFHQLGWDEITVAERRPSPQDFEKNKAFTYQVSALGQTLLKRLGIADRLDHFGVANTAFTATSIGPDGTAKTQDVPIIDANRPTCYWVTRRNLLTMLFEAIEERNDGRITLLYGHKVAGLESGSDGSACVTVESPSGEILNFSPDLLLACDGLSSVIRREAQARSDVADGHFTMLEHPSPAAQLRYKVLNLPAQFTAAGGDVPVDDFRMAYIFGSRFKDPKRATALFAFPVADPNHSRSVNLIREADHVLWTIDDANELLAFLSDAFPQLDIRALVSRQEAEDFVKLMPGQFPEPQFARNIHAKLGATQLLLIGDSAHAFPPDLGLGVNAAFDDLEQLSVALQANDELETAIARYAEAHQPEMEAMVRLVQTVFPEQYATRKWAMRRWMASFAVRSVLHKIAPKLFDRHAFLMTQDPLLDFQDIERRKLRTDSRVKALGWLAAATIGAVAAALTLR